MAREAKKLTKSALDRLLRKAKADPDFTTYVADSGQRGLYAWARRGRVRFVFAYRPPGGGRRRRVKIDEYGAITLDTARQIAQQWRGMVAAGRDPQVEVREEARLAVTLGEVVSRYLEDLRERAETGARRGRRSGYASARRLLEKHVRLKLGGVRIRELTVDQVRQLHRRMKDTPAEANRTLTALSAVFGYADRMDLTPAHFNPCRHVERFTEAGERRALTREELVALGRAMLEAEERQTVHPSALQAIRLLALTGFRRGEILGHAVKERRGQREGLRWGDVDLEQGLVALRQTKTGAQTRVIGEAVVRLLEAAKPADAEGDDPVCPGTVPGQPFVGIDKARARLYEVAGLSGLPGVDLHSLRHTFASVGAHVQDGRFAAFVGVLLGHGYTRRAITELYIHANPEALRPAADAIARAIGTSLGLEEQGRVIAFKPQAEA